MRRQLCVRYEPDRDHAAPDGRDDDVSDPYRGFSNGMRAVTFGTGSRACINFFAARIEFFDERNELKAMRA